MNAKIKKVIFIIVTLILALLFLEIAYRVMYSLKYRNPSYMLYGVKNIFRFDVNYFNEYLKLQEPKNVKKGEELYIGFRTAPFPIEKPKGEYRIAALGGSSTYGLYATYYESWPYLLEQKLNSGLKDKKYRVINTGVPGQPTYGIDKLLAAEVLGWDPDMVILYALFNHTMVDTPALFKERNKIDYSYRLLKGLFYCKSLLVTCLIDRISLRSAGVIRNKKETYTYLLSDIIERCNDSGVKIIVVKQLINPEQFPRINRDARERYKDVDAPTQYYDFLAIIDEVCGGHDCNMVDFSASSPVCRGKLDLLLSDKSVHLTDYGKDLLASVLTEKVIEIRESDD